MEDLSRPRRLDGRISALVNERVHAVRARRPGYAARRRSARLIKGVPRMPWKQWAYLERVTSPDFQSYLQNQTVPTFTNVAQRDSVYTPVPPPTGALCVTTDTLTVWKWNGSAWKPATTRSAARQQVLGTYDAAAPVNIYTAQIAATTDANGYVIVTPASIGMPVLTGVLNVIAQV